MKRKYGFLLSFIFIMLFALTACTGNGAPKKTEAAAASQTGGEAAKAPARSSNASASAATESAAGYQTISPAEAKKLIGTEGVVLVDVRTQEEYDEAHIAGAVLLPVDDIPQKAGAVLKDKNEKIIVYCRSGRRSAIAAKELLAMGYKDVYDLGGIIDWPYETVKK